jgi:hypothetical protein
MMKGLDLQNTRKPCCSQDTASVERGAKRSGSRRVVFDDTYSSSDASEASGNSAWKRFIRRRKSTNWYDINGTRPSGRDDPHCIVEEMSEIAIESPRFSSNVSEVSSLSCLEVHSDRDCPELYGAEDNISSTTPSAATMDTPVQRQTASMLSRDGGHNSLQRDY